MKNVTRRDFLHAGAGAAAVGAIVSHDPFLFSQALGADEKKDPPCGRECSPLDSLIFPKPQEISGSGSDFALDSDVFILLPSNPSGQDLLLASLLQNEIGDRHGIYLKTERAPSVPAGKRAILMGSTGNSLIHQYCSDKSLTASTQSLGPEGYILHSDNNVVVVVGSDDRGAFYGLQSLRQLIVAKNKQMRVRGVVIRDWPDKHFRGITLYLPGRDNIQFFKRFISDFMALYKFNTVIVEMNACMRLESHPELNNGWVEFARDINYSGRNYPLQPIHDMEQNSSHQDVADGAFLEKEEVADLARWISRYHIELVPQIPSFTHSYYLLTEHKDLAAVPENKWPDIYCPSNPKSYSLVFEVYDEYIEVLKPKMVHIGHDELFLPVGASPKCDDADIGELYGQDVKKIHDHLASKGVKTALWGDMLLQSVRGVGLQKKRAPDGWTYSAPGGLTREQVDRLIPKDCLIFNWFWADEPHARTSAELNEAYLDEMGFQQIYGNFEPTIEHYETRKKRPTLLGGAPSAWYATNEYGFGKDMMSLFLGCSSILWTGHLMPAKVRSTQVQSMMPGIRDGLSGRTPPSQTEISIVPLDISTKFNMGDTIAPLGVSVDKMLTGTVQLNNIPFALKNTNGMRAIMVGTDGKQPSGLAKSVTGIVVGEAPTSLVFLHASARRALNRDSLRLLWDQQDTADLLGWYEVVYQDGFVTTIPVRYGVNILEWNWNERISEDDYCYNADPVAIGARAKDQVTFFAYEWTNPRLGKVIQEIRLRGTTGFQGGSDDYSNDIGPIIANNAVILAALSVVRKRK
jgi:Glycosyl hydrolase family 20, domain 2/Glycosyl hydrolase family 20, catalytic domain